MADQNIFLQREARLFVQANAASDTDTEATKIFEIPILEGFSFSQSSNISEVTISEASTGTGNTGSRRGRMAYTDSLAPAEFSFSTYARPFKSAADDVAGNAEKNGTAKMHDPSEILFAMMAHNHAAAGDVQVPTSGGQAMVISGLAFGGNESTVDFNTTDFLQLAAHNFYFSFGNDAATDADSAATIYKLEDAVINEVTINFDIDGICTYEWSGFASRIIDATNADSPGAATDFQITPIVFEGRDSTNNLIMNRLSSLNITEVLDASSQYVDAGYDFALTGGSITISNGIEYVTPSSLNSVSLPLAHYAGTRSISGSFTCYLNAAANGSQDFLEDIIESSKFDVRNMFKLTANIGGTPNFAGSPTKPVVQCILPAAHIEIPVINVEEVLSVEVTFHGLPNDGSRAYNADGINGTPTAPTAYRITGGNEIQLNYEGPVPSTSTVSNDLTI